MTTPSNEQDTAPAPDSRVQYSELRDGEEQESPAPYDQARLDTHPDKIIVKGEREKPGPTAEDLGGGDLHRRINNELDAYEDEEEVREHDQGESVPGDASNGR